MNTLKMVSNPVQLWQADAAASVAPLRMFIPLSKIDIEKRLVYGIATAEAPDRAGETCDYASTKPYYEKWSGDISKASGGKNLGNVRSMHSPIAAGKVTSLTFNDVAKQIEICAEVVDDNEWKKVEKGVYTGFSQGGKYVKKWNDGGVMRYTADPAEVSLVDVPCLATATFEVVKGSEIIAKRHFDEAVQAKMPDNGAILNKAGELAKAANDGDISKFFDPARDALTKAALPLPDAPSTEPVAEPVAAAPAPSSAPSDDLKQVWQAKDGTPFEKKADAAAHNARILAAASLPQSALNAAAALDAIGKVLGADPAPAAPVSVSSVVIKAAEPATLDADSLRKNLFRVSRLAELLAMLRAQQESAEVDALYGYGETQDPAIGAAMKAWIAQGCGLLVQIVQLESAKLIGGADDAMAMAAGSKLKPGDFDSLAKVVADAPDFAAFLEKAGARNSKSDASKIQAMHDHACDLGATCDGDNCADGDASKTVGGGNLAKALGEMTAKHEAAEAGRAALQDLVEKKIMPTIETIAAKVEKIAKTPQPLPIHGSARVVEKGAGDGESLNAMTVEALEVLKVSDPRAYAGLMIKFQYQKPQQFQPAR